MFIRFFDKRKYFKSKKTSIKRVFFLLFISAILFAFLLKIYIANNEIETGVLKSCTNKVTKEYNNSVWTLLNNQLDYANSVVKLFMSAKKHNLRKYDILILELDSHLLSEKIKRVFINFGWKICRINHVKLHDKIDDSFAKLIFWSFTEYDSIIYFDPDILIIRNTYPLTKVHKYLNETIKIAATNEFSNGEWKNNIDTSVFVIKPDYTEFQRLVNLTNYESSFKKMNSFNDFINRVYQKNQTYDIGFYYNANMALYSQDPDFWTKNEDQINIIHYDIVKPWNCSIQFSDICEYWLDSYCNIF
jgi:alpha-N-acetylglucosamine transferase